MDAKTNENPWRIEEKDILYTTADGCVARKPDGSFITIPKPRFFNGQFVSTTQGHHSPKEFTSVVDPTYTSSSGWVYGEHYVDRDGHGGGFGYSFKEELFTEITDPMDILYAERLYRKQAIEKAESRLKILREELNKINFAMSIMVPKPEGL